MTPLLFLAQRLSAAVLALAVAVHLATILYAVRGGLTAGEILAPHPRQSGVLRVLLAVRRRGRGPCPDRAAQCHPRMDAVARAYRSMRRSRSSRCCLLVLGLRAVFAVYAA